MIKLFALARGGASVLEICTMYRIVYIYSDVPGSEYLEILLYEPFSGNTL